MLRKVRKLRNVVHEMVAELEAIKPIRAPQRELQHSPAYIRQPGGRMSVAS